VPLPGPDSDYDPPISIFQVAGITDMYYHTQSLGTILKIRKSIIKRLVVQGVVLGAHMKNLTLENLI
jgi:hypothetical protein